MLLKHYWGVVVAEVLQCYWNSVEGACVMQEYSKDITYRVLGHCDKS